mgnify:CR=1 FL=1|nr:ABC transporter permease [uncultured Blautia sp.]
MKNFMKKTIHNKMALIGGIIVLAVIIISIISPLLLTCDPEAMDYLALLQTPSGTHILGTDSLGRDIYSRIMAGSRTSLLIGLLVVGISTVFGSIIGVISGFYGGKLDSIIMKITDTLMAFPSIMLALFFVTVFGGGLYSAIVGVAIASIPRFIRLVRGSVLSIKEKEYIEAEYAVGQTNMKIMLRHILPNCAGPLIVQATLTMGNAIMTVASLGFLGLGAAPGQAEWGSMLSDAREYLRSAPYVAVYPGLAIAVTVLGFNLLGDGLRDVMDVRQD